MPAGMRFCRSCGNRLGEGPAEYTETVRLPNGAARPNAQFSSQYVPGGPMMPTAPAGYPQKRRRLGFTGTTWLWIVLVAFFAFGGMMSMVSKRAGLRPPAAFAPSSRSYVSIDGLKTTDGGVTFEVASPPDGPADKAGLVGGDIITSFDGHPITKDSELIALLRQIPIGKNVEVVYIRDGIFHNTRLTTVSNEENDRLKEVFANRPEGRSYFGFEKDRTTRVSTPETKTYGVQIDWVEPNGPADLFGIKVGDIITDFDKVPIRTGEELLSRVMRATPKSVVDVVVLRDGKPLTIPVTVGRRAR
jgi:S1-C subfamily serine protease